MLILAIAGVGAFGVVANREPADRFCALGAPIVPPSFELEGYEVTFQDGGEPGPGACDNPDRPGHPVQDDTGGYRVPPASTRPGYEPYDVADPRVVLGFDCRYRDADGDVVASAEPNRPNGTCTIPGG